MCPLAIIDKRRPKANVSEIMNIIGDVRNKRVILVDDLIDTGGTIVNAANALAEIGAIEVFACCTHAVLSGPAIERIRHSAIKELVTLDTIPLNEACRIPQIRVLTVADVFAEAIERIYGGHVHLHAVHAAVAPVPDGRCRKNASGRPFRLPIDLVGISRRHHVRHRRPGKSGRPIRQDPAQCRIRHA